MSYTVDLFLDKENFKFSAGHFTIFSATERENLHGHNFTVGVELSCEVIANGMTFDYGLAKRAVEKICRSLNETFLIPANSQFLQVADDGHRWLLDFAGESFSFLKRDATLLPLANITVEELAYWFLERLIAEFASAPEHRIRSLSVSISSGPGQGARASKTLL